MQWWYYRGTVTTPINIPGKGPTVIRPRDKFQAPLAAVVHLKKLGYVVICKPPKEVSKQASPKIEPKKNEVVEEFTLEPENVVISLVEPQAEVVEEESIEAIVDEIIDDEPQETKKKKRKSKKS